MAINIPLDSLWNSLFNNIFCFGKEFISLSYYPRAFSLGAIDSGFHFQNYRILEDFGFYLLTTVYWLQSVRKNNTRNFLFICLFAKLQWKIFVFANSAVKPQHVLFVNEPFLRKMLVSLFSSNIPQYIEKIPMEKLCRILEMKLKTYILVDSKLVSEKIEFKALHYMQHNFIYQCPELSKDQISIFKSLAIN